MSILSVRPFPLLTASVLAMATAAFAAKAPKVDLCHVGDGGTLHRISVSQNALKAHAAHGDLVVGVDVDENCQPLVVETDYCVRGEFPGFADEFFQVTHNAATGAVVGENVTHGGPLSGTVTPVGSVFTAGATYDFTNDASYGTWTSTSTASSADGVFSGTWFAPWGIGPAIYTFTAGACN